MKKLKSILLVDDHEPVNFLHELLILENDLAENIKITNTGLEAIQYLSTPKEGIYPSPDMILLDINMPVMNGWEFLEEYEKLPIQQKANIVIVMVTTSLNPDDRKKAENLKDIKAFANKPFTLERFQEIMTQFF